MATEEQHLPLLETGTFEQGFEGCTGVCALNWQLSSCCCRVSSFRGGGHTGLRCEWQRPSDVFLR